MSAEISPILSVAMHKQVAYRLRQMLVESRIASGANLQETGSPAHLFLEA